MLFIIENKKYLSPNQLRTDTLLNAYFVIQNYPIGPAEIQLDNYIQQQYKIDLKNLCLSLILSLTFHKDKSGNLILVFKNPKDDKLARLITYGTGIIPGSKILQIALK